MSLSIGIVGLPNVGKSTLFNALLKQNLALAANYPFATIEPNVGIAPVPDERLAVLAKIVKTTVLKPATIEFIDIAGLVAGASAGAGLGNKFLAHIRETNAIAHVLRAFTDTEVIREGSQTPEADLATIRMELQLADLATVKKQKAPKGGMLAAEEEKWKVIKECGDFLRAGKNVRVYIESLEKEEREKAQKIADELNLLTSKPEIFVLNVDEGALTEEKTLRQKYTKILEVKEEQIVVVSAKIEAELSALSEDDQKAFLIDLGLEESGLSRLARVAYQTLGLQSFLTAGELEVKAWTIKKGTLAPDAAGVIHTDFIKKFVKAKVLSYEDFVKYQGWKAAGEAGKVRIEGRDYVMRANDVVEFMINK